jgi:hypothetical protein
MSTRSFGSQVSTVLSLTASALSAGLGIWLWLNVEPPVRFAACAALASSGLAFASIFFRSTTVAPESTPVPMPPVSLPAPIASSAPIAPTPAPAPVPLTPALDPVMLADAGALRLLAKLQEQGRLLDFAMEDIRTVPDAQVAAVARVVHTGCREALQSTFTLEPLQAAQEGSTVTLAPGFDPEAHRLLGRVAGAAPFTGKLLHRGWRNTGAVKLPHASDAAKPHSGIIAPAEIELR